jgi:hypothetical protein
MKASRTKNNYVGQKFGSLTVTKQYYLNDKGSLKVDYQCECGNILIGREFSKVRRQKMCRKCKSSNRFKILPFGETSFNLLYSSYIRSAKKRGLCFELSREEFRFFTKQKCIYCGSIPQSVTRPNSVGGGYVYNGIDRKDSDKGYILRNCVPCCSQCNYSKLKYSVQKFLSHIEKIHQYQSKSIEELNTLNTRIESLRKAVDWAKQSPRTIKTSEVLEMAEFFVEHK